MAGEHWSAMNGLPPFLEASQFLGSDSAEKWGNYINGLYNVYLTTVAHATLLFRTLPVRCQFRPETHGKHFAFWHMMQEGFREEDRNIDPERCRRVAWISWVIQNAERDSRIRIFRQQRNTELSWVLWLYEENYAVILWERKGYFLLKTAFMVKPHKQMEFERDWAARKNG